MSHLATSDITSFSSRLQKVLRKTERGNLVYSPLGVTLCSSMAYVGAEGNTKTEMETALGYPADQKNPFPAKLMKLLNEDEADSFTLKTVQQVFIQKGYDVLPEYLAKLKKLEVGVGQIDHKEAQRSCNEVNAWVRKASNNKIKEIVKKREFNKGLRLILINSIYFHGKWEVPFPKKNTKPRDFFFDNGKVDKVRMMTRTGCQFDVLYVNCQKLKAEIVKIPYKGKRFCMLVFIPNPKKDLSTIEKGLRTMSVDDCLKELNGFKNILKNESVLNITLPKFEFESDLDLIGPLKQLGIEDAFDIEEADFSEITDDPFGLYISSVIQKAMVKVDEDGTTAAAVTVCKMKSGFGGIPKPKKIINVVADRPFFFQIIEQRMQIVLFSGVVSDPRK